MANIESVKLPNGSEYNIKDAISGYALQSEMSVTDGTGSDADKTTIQLKSGTSVTVLKTHQSISGKADKVTGGTNGNLASLDGNGNLTDAGVALNISAPSNGQVMTYNGTSSKWENATMDLSSRAAKTDISSILATGATNTTGATITAGTYFYLNGTFVKAKADIANGASYTSGTNYEAVTVGDQLTVLNSNLATSLSNIDISTHLIGVAYNLCLLRFGKLRLLNYGGAKNLTPGSYTQIGTLSASDVPSYTVISTSEYASNGSALAVYANGEISVRSDSEATDYATHLLVWFVN